MIAPQTRILPPLTVEMFGRSYLTTAGFAVMSVGGSALTAALVIFVLWAFA